MTILKAELIAIVNKKLHRGYTGTALDEDITSVLKDLSTQGNFLQDEFKMETIENRDYYSLPDNMTDLLFIGIKSSDDATIYRDLIYERWEMYKRNIYYDSTSGTPTRYTWMSGYLYPRPIPDDVYNLYLWYAFYHPETLTVDEVEYKACDYILFNDIYRQAIEMGLCYQVALGLELEKQAKTFLGLYMNQVAIRKAALPVHGQVAAYRDGF